MSMKIGSDITMTGPRVEWAEWVKFETGCRNGTIGNISDCNLDEILRLKQQNSSVRDTFRAGGLERAA